MPMSEVLDARPKIIGASVKRTEDPRLLTGRGSFVDDRSANRADPFLIFPFFDYLAAVPVGWSENEKALSNPFGESLSYFSG